MTYTYKDEHDVTYENEKIGRVSITVTSDSKFATAGLEEVTFDALVKVAGRAADNHAAELVKSVMADLREQAD